MKAIGGAVGAREGGSQFNEADLRRGGLFAHAVAPFLIDSARSTSIRLAVKAVAGTTWLFVGPLGRDKPSTTS